MKYVLVSWLYCIILLFTKEVTFHFFMQFTIFFVADFSGEYDFHLLNHVFLMHFTHFKYVRGCFRKETFCGILFFCWKLVLFNEIKIFTNMRMENHIFLYHKRALTSYTLLILIFKPKTSCYLFWSNLYAFLIIN